MSQYGAQFDRKAETWNVLEAEHDRHHPNRSECGGVGGCSMMFAANCLEQELIDALEKWRKRGNA